MTATSKEYAELLVRLLHEEDKAYTVETRFSAPRTDAFAEPEAGKAVFDFPALASLRDETSAYGTCLSKALFADPRVLTSYTDALAKATDDGQPVPLRLRLDIDIDEQELHALRWELLCDPISGAPLANNQRILFSRYLRSASLAPVQRRTRSSMRALVVVASPADLANYAPEDEPLQPLNLETELALAGEALGDMLKDRLVGKGNATLEKLVTRLRDPDGWDIVYIACHGALVKGRALLYLEDVDGNTDVVPGTELASEVARLLKIPRLIVLASCQSAGSGKRGAVAAIGPLLAREGVPAVLAMQGKITIETASQFMKRFFEELDIDGQVDRSVAVARGEVQRSDRPDAWMPVLFTRLQSGSIWTVPAALSGKIWEAWDSLLDMIESGSCLPILGPGIIEFLLGTHQEIAQRWADTYRFPLMVQVRRDLPQVAQYLAVTQRNPDFPERELRRYLTREMRTRYAEILSGLGNDASLDQMVQAVGRDRRQNMPFDAFKVLAQMRLPVYITTNPDNLLRDAIEELDIEPIAQPEVDAFHWKPDNEVDWPEPVLDRDPDYRPSKQRPLIYHLFGQLETENSAVLTEDDHFKYLVAVSQREASIPPFVSRAWSSQTLLFLGFRVDDWRFRVLFQSIMKDQGSNRRKRKPHVAVQLDVEDGQTMDPERAQIYLERYFEDEQIDIYWGSADTFIRTLWTKWQARHPSANGARPAGG
jgi:hypothetical protein